MKKTFIILSILLFASCGSENTYVKTIAEFVQTDSYGTRYDMNFKALNTEILQQITVGDSIKKITEKFDLGKNKRIESIEKTIKRNTDMIEKERAVRYPSKTMINFYESNIAQNINLADSLRRTKPDNLEPYLNRQEDEILAIVVRCTYSIDEPITNLRATETFDFFLSPDGAKCYSQKRVKE